MVSFRYGSKVMIVNAGFDNVLKMQTLLLLMNERGIIIMMMFNGKVGHKGPP